ncbi:MAG: SGNH/GDSL hydrolase family protein [bacterium]
MSRHSWRSVLLVGALAATVVVACDLAVQRVVPIQHQSEVEDAIAELRRSDPTVLVLGSSHARTWEVVGEEVARRTNGATRILAVPVEFGKLRVYDWVLRHRILPLLDDLGPDGRPRRPSVSHVILVTEWWDSLDDGTPPANLPSRAWTSRDFLEDATKHGLVAYNRNWLTSRWLRLTRGSILAQDRGYGRVTKGLVRAIRGDDPESERQDTIFRVRKWQRMIEAGAEGVCAPEDMAALADMISILEDRDLDVTIVLYPRKPATITPRAEETTLATYAREVRRVAGPAGVPVHDWSTQNPLTDADFRDDFDHVTPEGNRLLTEWMLDGDLRWLVAPDAGDNVTADAKPALGGRS